MKLLVEKGADANRVDKMGHTPLFWAAGNGHADTVRSLLSCKGICIEARDKGQTPLSWAVSERSENTAQLLLKVDAEPNARDSHGQVSL